MGRSNTELVQLLLIPRVDRSPEEQILTLKHTLSKLGMLTVQERETVSLDMLKYMQSLDSQESLRPLGFILDGLTVTEQEALLSLVESAKQLLEQQESKKSTTPSSGLRSWTLPLAATGIGIGKGVGIGGLGTATATNFNKQDLMKLQQMLIDIEKDDKQNARKLSETITIQKPKNYTKKEI